MSTDQAEDASLEGTEVKVEEDATNATNAAFAATAGAAADTLGKLTEVDIEHQLKMEWFWLQINKHFLQAVELEATQSIDLEPMETDKNTKVSCDWILFLKGMIEQTLERKPFCFLITNPQKK